MSKKTHFFESLSAKFYNLYTIDFYYLLFLLHVWIFASYHLKIKFSYRPLFCQRQKHQARGDGRGGGAQERGELFSGVFVEIVF